MMHVTLGMLVASLASTQKSMELRSSTMMTAIQKKCLKKLDMQSSTIMLPIFLLQAHLEGCDRRVPEKLTPEQQAQVQKQVMQQAATVGDTSYKGLAASAAVVAAAKAGGFGTYMLMSSVLSTVSTGTLGIWCLYLCFYRTERTARPGRSGCHGCLRPVDTGQSEQGKGGKPCRRMCHDFHAPS